MTDDDPTGTDRTPELPRALTGDALPYITEKPKVRTGRGWKALPWVAGVGAVAIILGLVFWGVGQRDAVREAEAEVEVWQDEVRRLNDDRAGSETELEDAEEEIRSLGAEVERLQAQLGETGAQLQQANEANVAATGDIERLRLVAASGPAVVAEMQRCADARNAVADRAIELAANPLAPRDAFDRAVADANRICTQAAQSQDRLQEAVDDLDQP
jgi:chromosome segregation ATPase